MGQDIAHTGPASRQHGYQFRPNSVACQSCLARLRWLRKRWTFPIGGCCVAEDARGDVLRDGSLHRQTWHGMAAAKTCHTPTRQGYFCKEMPLKVEARQWTACLNAYFLTRDGMHQLKTLRISNMLPP